MAFFMQDNLKEIGHFSRLHGYSGKLVISFIKENPFSSYKKYNNLVKYFWTNHTF